MNYRIMMGLLVAALAEQTSGACRAQNIEDLNLVGAVASMPKISDSVAGTETGFRKALFRHGILLRANVLPRFSVNLLDRPVPAGQQVYIGQRPTWITGVNPILTADLRQLGLKNAQLNIGGAWRWTNWNPAGPKAVSLSSFYLYKMWGEDRLQLKVGYIPNDTEFVGLQVGGNLATGAQGVYAVLPYQVGMSYFPLTAPALNLRFRGPGGTYWKTGAQRSLDPAGGVVNGARNPSGLRFIPRGDGLLLINEAGYQRTSGADAKQVWLRGGYLYNNTRYTNRLTGLREAGNYCYYLLLDYQLTQRGQNPGHGWYLGGTAMGAPTRFNSYDRYYEGRLYRKAPFVSRPDDVLSFVAAFRSHSKSVTDKLESQGKTAWHNSPSVTGSYSAHVSRGNYLTVALGYVRGAAITPRVADNVTFTANWGVYF